MKRKEIIVMIIIVFAIAWLLGMLRFDYKIADVLFQTLLLPFGWLMVKYEQYTQTLSTSNFLKREEEIIVIFVFVFLCVLQSLLYLFIYRIIKIRFFNKKNDKKLSNSAVV